MKRPFSLFSGFCFAAILSLLFAATNVSAEDTSISIGTGGKGGVYYPYGVGLAEIWTQYVDRVKAVAEVTGGSVENVRLADRGEAVIGTVMGDVAYQAFYAQGRFEGKPQKIHAVFMMYPNLYQVVVPKESKVKSIFDVEGKKVSVGPPGSGTEFMTNLIFEALGISYNTFEVRRLSFSETANALRDSTIDVGIWCVAPGTSSIRDLAATHDIRLIDFTPEQQKKVTDKYIFYAPFDLAADTYKGAGNDIPTISVWNVVICSADLGEEFVYNLVKAVFDHQDFLTRIHPFAKYTTPENALNTSPIPFHPGAVKFYKEKGYAIPDRLMPK